MADHHPRSMRFQVSPPPQGPKGFLQSHQKAMRTIIGRLGLTGIRESAPGFDQVRFHTRCNRVVRCCRASLAQRSPSQKRAMRAQASVRLWSSAATLSRR